VDGLQCIVIESVFAVQVQTQAATAQAGEVAGEREQHQAKSKKNRWLAIGFGGVIGGVLIGVTGGLAAPLVAAGLGTALGTGTGAALATTAGVYTIGSLFAAGGSGLLVSRATISPHRISTWPRCSTALSQCCVA
jgi:hypothetical protein